MNHEEIKQQKIILFDGVCNLCTGSVLFVLKREKRPSFKFASLQSNAGQQLLAWGRLAADFREAVILIDQGKMHLGSTAALKIGQTLKFPWSLLASIGLLVPKPVRDWAYSQIAKHRYQWFGRKDMCMVPTENLKSRFL